MYVLWDEPVFVLKLFLLLCQTRELEVEKLQQIRGQSVFTQRKGLASFEKLQKKLEKKGSQKSM